LTYPLNSQQTSNNLKRTSGLVISTSLCYWCTLWL